MTVNIPTVTCDDLATFHAKHFTTHDFNQSTASDFFSSPFIATEPQVLDYEELHDDDLGYYPDGVKRTLTDQQIQIFRHSEIQTLLRQKQLEEEASGNSSEAKPHRIEDEMHDQTNGASSHKQKNTCDEGGQFELPKETNDIKCQTAATSSAIKRAKPNDINRHGIQKQETKQAPKQPAEFRRRIVSYEDT